MKTLSAAATAAAARRWADLVPLVTWTPYRDRFTTSTSGPDSITVRVSDLSRLTIGGQTWLPHVVSMGTLQDSLGLLTPTATPATWDVTLDGHAKTLQGVRVVDLIRHGLNQSTGRYDPGLGDLTLSVAFAGTTSTADIIPLAQLYVDEIQATEDRVTLRAVGRDRVIDFTAESGIPFASSVLNIGNWFSYDGFGVELDCAGGVTEESPPGMTDDGTYDGPWGFDLLIDYLRCAPADAEDVDRFTYQTLALFRDLTRLPGTTLRINWTGIFSEVDDGTGFVPGPNVSLQIVVFDPPASQAELEAYRSGLFGTAAAPTVARVITTESFAHGAVPGIKNYTLGATEQFLGVIMGAPAEPGPDANDTTYVEAAGSLSIV